MNYNNFDLLFQVFGKGGRSHSYTLPQLKAIWNCEPTSDKSFQEVIKNHCKVAPSEHLEWSSFLCEVADWKPTILPQMMLVAKQAVKPPEFLLVEAILIESPKEILVETQKPIDVCIPIVAELNSGEKVSISTSNKIRLSCASEFRKSELHYEAYEPLLLGGSGRRGRARGRGANRSRRGRSNRPKRKNETSKTNWSLSRSLMTSGPAPPHMDVTMSYTATILYSSTTPFLVYDFRMNNITQVDPLVSGSATSGALSWSGVYSQYNVKGFRLRYNFVTNETSTAQVMGFVFRDYQPTLSITSLLLAEQSLGLSPTTGPRGIGETTGSSVYRSPSYGIPPSVVLGNRLQYYAEKDFAGNFTTGPLQTLWAGFVLYNPIISNVSGTLTVVMDYLVHLYSPSPNLITLVHQVDALSLDDKVVFEQ